MLQIIQNYKTGKLELAKVPPPLLKAGGVLVHNINSVISVGTEKLMIELAQKSLLGKARARPDLVKQVLNKIKTEGLRETYKQAMGRLDTPQPLGYSSAGKIIEVGSEAQDEFSVGERVACAGSNFASHAEIIYVPKNLCVKIPEGVSFEQAAFGMLGAIALHGVRLSQPEIGKKIVLIGTGLLGLIALQLLKASGCQVMATDIDKEKLSLCQKLAADKVGLIRVDNIPQKVLNFTSGIGADSVIILASTKSREPIELAGEIARDQGRVVIVGQVRIDIPRKLFYEKELKVVVSRSSGPGIYDPLYELKGIDYPISYVRWTQKRNIQAFLELVSQGKVSLEPLITHRFPISQAEKAYDIITKKTKEKPIGVLLSYAQKKKRVSTKIITAKKVKPRPSKIPQVGLVGAGLFAQGTLLPALKKLKGINLKGVAAAEGSTAFHTAKKYGFDYCTTQYKEILSDREINAVMIATPHNLHAKMTIEALKSQKNVFVEKPLALNLKELKQIYKTWKKSESLLMVGFNRRFSPLAIKAKKFLTKISSSQLITYRVNAGFLSKDHWIHDPKKGGGRILGEVCHFIDLIQYFTNSLPIKVYAETISGKTGPYLKNDNLIITLKLENGSIATILYTASGSKAFPRERIEIFAGGCVAVLENFKALSLTGAGHSQRKHLLNINWGHLPQWQTFFEAVKKGEQPIDIEEYLTTTLTTFAIEKSLATGKPQTVDINAILP